MSGSLPDVEFLGLDDLKKLVLKLVEENAGLRAEVAALRAENRRLRGLKGPPSLKPSGMDKETGPKPKGGSGARRRGSYPRSRRPGRLPVQGL
ncbi:MAG: hypothetical protein MK293_14510 [Pedosphaera sp.]|jgi:regulator of replication initiation timing|nr:hypothetical protein [Pedosphaera sp.]